MYFVEKTKGISIFKRFDYILFIAVILLTVIGIIALYSATRVMPNGADGNKKMISQLIGVGIGLILAIIISAFDYKDFKTLGIFIYLFSVGLLVLVLQFGTDLSQGSKSWFRVPFMGTFQPSELAKIAFVIFISIFLERIKDGAKDKYINIIKFLIYAMIPIGLIAMQPDFGTTMVFVFAFFVMVFICGIKYRYILAAFIAAIPVSLYMWFFKFEKYQKDRFFSFLTPEKYLKGSAWNVYKSKIAIGSGQVTGNGLFKGIQTQSAGVPVKESDFIFSVIGEELGFMGAAAVILLILVILLRCIYIAKNSRETYGSFVVTGIVSMMGFHFIENIGMGIGLLPVTGIPLPFVSQGGSSMITNFIAVGIVMSVSSRRKKVIFNNSE